MKSTIVLALGLALAGSFSISATTEAAPEVAPKPTEVKKGKVKVKKKPVVTPGTNDDGGADRLVNCWCSGGADGNGPAQCQADDCDSADSCCVTAYGAGAEAEDQ